MRGEARVLLTNNYDDTVSVVSLERLSAGRADAELARMPVGLVPVEREGPHHIAASSDGRFAWVGISNYVPGAGSGPHGVHGAGTADGRVLKIDLSTLRTIADERVDRNPGDVRLTPDGRLVLASHFDLVRVNEAASVGIERGPELFARLAILDAETLTRQAMVPVCPAPHGIAVTPDSNTVVLSCLDDQVAIVDLADPTHPVARLDVIDEPGTARAPLCGPYAITIDPSGETAWVSCYQDGRLIAVDIASATLDGRVVQLPGRAVFGSFSADGSLLAVAAQTLDAVVFVDAAAGVIDHLRPTPPDVCALPHGTMFVDDDRSLLVVCEGNKVDPGTLALLDVASGAIWGQVPLGLFPDDLALAVATP